MKQGIIAVILGVAIIGGIFGVKSFEYIGTGKVGVVYTMRGGVQDDTLDTGVHFISPFEKVKEFTVANEQIILSKDDRDESEGDESFKVATADDASISISFQMSYRYNPDTVVDTYKKFKGMDGEDIVEKRVKTVLKSEVSEITTDYSLMDIYSGNRAEINDRLTEYLNKQFTKDYGINVLNASIIDVHPDKQLKKAINNRVAALQEKQQAEAEQEKVKVEAETKKIQAEKEAEVNKIKSESDAEIQITKAKAEAEANRLLSESITENLIKMKEAEARYKNGWVTVIGADTVVTN